MRVHGFKAGISFPVCVEVQEHQGLALKIIVTALFWFNQEMKSIKDSWFIQSEFNLINLKLGLHSL